MRNTTIRLPLQDSRLRHWVTVSATCASSPEPIRWTSKPVCGAPGTETEINTDSRLSDGKVQCTSRITASPLATISLTVKNTRLEHLRARHCVFAGDTTSPAVHLEFDGKGQMTVILFGILVFATVLATVFAVLAWNDRRVGGTQPGDIMHGIYEFTGARWFVALIVILAGASTWLAHAEWGNHTEFHVTLGLAIFAVVLPIGLLVWDARIPLKPATTVATDVFQAFRANGANGANGATLPRRMRTMTVGRFN